MINWTEKTIWVQTRQCKQDSKIKEGGMTARWTSTSLIPDNQDCPKDAKNVKNAPIPYAGLCLYVFHLNCDC